MKKYYLVIMASVLLITGTAYALPNNSTYTENVIPYFHNTYGIGLNANRYLYSFITNSTSTTNYVSNVLSVGSTSPTVTLNVQGKGAFSDKLSVSSTQYFSCLGGCSGGTLAGGIVEGVSFTGGLGGHFRSTEVLPTPSMDCWIASGDVSPDGYGMKCVNGSITAVLIDTYTAGANGRPANLFYVTGPGMFGIGTSSPFGRLSVEGDAGGTTTLLVKPFNVQTAPIVDIMAPGGASSIFQIASTSRIDITTSATLNTGLNMYGNVNDFYQLNIQNKNAGVNASGDLSITADNGDENTHYINMGTNNSNGAKAPFTTANETYLYSISDTLNIGALGTNSGLKFYTTGGMNTPVQRMNIDSSGFVGIGTTSPYAEFSVGSTTTATTTAVFIPNATISGAHLIDFYAQSIGPHSTITAVGNWGIGTTSPGTILSVQGVGNFTNGTSTLYTGLNLTTGCFSITNTCVNGVTNGFAGMITGWTTGTSLNATSTPTARAYFATSTTATSTFMGKLAVGTTTLSMPADSVLFVGGKVAIDKGTSNATSTINLGNVGRSNPGCINWVWQNGASYSTSSVYINTAGALVTEPNSCR